MTMNVNIFFVGFLSFHYANCVVNWETVNVDEINQLILTGHTCKSITQDFINRIDQFNNKLSSINAVITINSHAIDDAKELDNFYSLSKILKGSLHCVPTLIKDNIDVQYAYFVPRTRYYIFTYHHILLIIYL